jgi:hypothetical protein
MRNVDEVLKSSVPVDIMFVMSKERAQSAKYFYEDGLVDYNGDMMEPEAAFIRYIDEHPLLTVICGNISRRHIEEYKGKSYRWESLKDLRR